MNLFSKTGLALTLLGAAATGSAQAGSGPVPIFSTGVDANGAALANGASDSHYTLVSAPAGFTGALNVVTSASGYPVAPYGDWIGDSAGSAWLGPNDIFADGPIGIYDYQTTFDLTGFDPATATLTGNWAADDTGSDILLNGVSTGNATANGYTAYTPFSFTSGFHTGLNTLDFLVTNDQGPTGLRVDGLTVTADGAPVPEASTTISLGLLLTLGLGGLLAARRKSAQV